jgi:hypothetical protein
MPRETQPTARGCGVPPASHGAVGGLSWGRWKGCSAGGGRYGIFRIPRVITALDFVYERKARCPTDIPALVHFGAGSRRLFTEAANHR